MSVLARRLRAQLLSGAPARDPVAVTQRLLAVQAQDGRGARLAIRARTTGLSVADFDRALAERRLLITWLNRGTLHLVRSEDYAWLHALTTPQLFTGSVRRLAQEGVSAEGAERGIATIVRSLEREGPLNRYELRERVAAAGVRTERQALVHQLALASHRGLIVRGPMIGGHHAYVLTRDWLGEAPALDRDRALAELARRYLAGHGPADERDLARWAGLPLRDARAGLRAIASELTDSSGGLVELRSAGEAEEPPLPAPRLLGAYEPVLLGWVDRTPIVDDRERLITSNGLFRAFALAGGRAVATWGLAGETLKLSPFDVLAPTVARALDADAEDVLRFLSSTNGE